ncbi:hypothetical protein D3C80_1863490 [compost metagenome]
MKFHLMDLLPSSPGAWAVSQRYSGWAPSPLTSILAISGNCTPKLRSQKVAISSALPGSC